ncbi:unnamed protein product [Schistosoma margrebowiei]|uniref:Uncharacterized protein n=1 Tax=Schistosoma margrebowiei TaxID=48269 RepID=A0AA85AQX5_9TREM|nr:unnamed protein product [Schistosoma margrebowiei]
MIQSNEHTTIYFALMIVFTSLNTANGQYKPAYLETNMVENDANTNTFRVIQEQTTAMAFEWKPMTHENFGYVNLLQDITGWFDQSVRIHEGNIGLLKAIGKPCELSKYRAEGCTNNFVCSIFNTFHMTYKRVPRINNVQIQLRSNMYSHVKWERERTACEPTDSIIIFRGFSNQTLKMYTITSNQIEYYSDEFKTEEGMEEVFIVFNKHGNRFSLPTMAKYKKPVWKGNTEQPTNQTKLTASNITVSSFLENTSTTYVFISTLILVIFVVSIVLFFLIKML